MKGGSIVTWKSAPLSLDNDSGAPKRGELIFPILWPPSAKSNMQSHPDSNHSCVRPLFPCLAAILSSVDAADHSIHLDDMGSVSCHCYAYRSIHNHRPNERNGDVSEYLWYDK